MLFILITVVYRIRTGLR